LPRAPYLSREEQRDKRKRVDRLTSPARSNATSGRGRLASAVREAGGGRPINGLLASRTARARNPLELVPSVASLREATPPHCGAVGRSSRARSSRARSSRARSSRARSSRARSSRARSSRAHHVGIARSDTPELLLDRAPRGRGGGSLAEPARRRGGPINGVLASRTARARNPLELVPSVASLREATPPHGGAVGRSSRARSSRARSSRARSSRAHHVGIARSDTPELLLDRAPRGRGGGSLAKPARRRGGPINGLLASRTARARNPLELVPSVASLREATPPHGCSRGEEFQSEEFQSEEFQTAPRRDRAFRHSGTPPRPSTARSGRWLAGEASETEGRSDERVARLAIRRCGRRPISRSDRRRPRRASPRPPARPASRGSRPRGSRHVLSRGRGASCARASPGSAPPRTSADRAPPR